MTEPDRGESYLEIQMDRSTIVLAGLGLLACIVVAFLLGSWTASRKAAADQEMAAAASGPDGAADDAEATDQEVDAEPNFGGRPVSAAGAPPMTAVPAPKTATDAARPNGSSGITIASDGGIETEDVAAAAPAKPAARPSGSTSASGAASTSRTATSSKTTSFKTSSSSATPSASASTTTSTPASKAAVAPGEGWVVQVSAAKQRSDADALRKRLEGKGYSVRIVEEGGYHKVQVGPYATQAEAKSAADRLEREQRSLETWVKRA